MAACGPQFRSIKMHTYLMHIILPKAAKSAVISQTTENYSLNQSLILGGLSSSLIKTSI